MWYLEITNNNKIYRLNFDGSMAMQTNSEMFYDETSHSLYMTFKNTDNNREAFGFLNKPEITDNKSRELNSTLRADPIVIPGTLVVTFKGGEFSGYFKQNGNFWNAIKDKYLKDMLWDIITFNPGTGYDEIFEFIADYMDLADHDFTFPRAINYKLDEQFPIEILMQYHINLESGFEGVQHPIIPFFFLHCVYTNIFIKNGINIDKNAFDNSFLKRLCIVSNYLLNEFYIDTTVAVTKNNIIAIIANTTEPTITTLKAHGLTSNQFIEIKNISNNPPVENRIFQIEVVDATNFKLLKEDFTAFIEYNKLYIPVDTIFASESLDTPYSYNHYLLFHVDKEIWEDWQVVYIYSDDYEGYGVLRRTIVDNTWAKLYVPDPNIGIHTYANLKFIIIESGTVTVDETAEGVYPYHLYLTVNNVVNEGTIEVISGIKSEFKELNPANHMPDIKIKDFLKEYQYFLGIISFVRNGFVDIKNFRDIIRSSDFIDVSQFSQLIKDIENPDLDGFLLQMASDSNDSFYKSWLPIQALDEYTVKDNVATKSNLIYTGSATKDARLVIDEDKYYTFSKMFLNADNNWSILCHNLLDMKESNGDLRISTKWSPLAYVGGDTPLRYDINCNCKPFDSGVKMNPRLAIYHGIFDSSPWLTNDIYDPDGNAIAGAEFALRWDGDHGIYEKRLKEYINWQLNVRKDCIAIIQWPMHLLANFDFSKKYRIRGIDYFVKSIKYTLDFKTNKIVFNETELAKV